MSLPNFLCIGAPKSATTSLFEILKQHPEIGLSSFKEPHFFDNDANWKQGIEWYEKSYFLEIEQNIIGEFTPSYLGNSACSLRIKKTLGDDIKFILLLRNPVDRAYSHYLHTKRDEHETLSFLDALREEEDRLQHFQKKQDNISYSRFCYLDSGRYATHLRSYLQYFDRKQFCVILFDDFVNNRKEVVNRILSFLNVSTEIDLNLNVFANQASEARSIKLKKFMKRKSLFREVLKFFIPSLELRQRIRNRLHDRNNRIISKEPLSKEEREFCYRTYFSDEICDLEKILNINLNMWKL